MIGIPILPSSGGGSNPPPPTTPPGTQRVLSWTDTSDNEDFFWLQWRTDTSFPNWVDINTQIAKNSVSYPHNIGTATGDCYRIAATNQGGSSGFTDPVCAGAVEPPPTLPPPVGPGPLAIDWEEDLL
jgi:hypothetical protein